MIAESAEYAYSKSADAIWVNLYGGSLLVTELGGEQIKLSQETEYPWSGRVRIKILECGKKEFALRLRLPGWVKAASVRVSNQPKLADQETGAPKYFEIRRAWQTGDFVDLDLPMPVRLMEANPLVEADVNQVAVQRGPVVYCLESPDLPVGVKIPEVRIPVGVELQARFDKRLLGGIVVLEGNVLTRVAAGWSGKLYREMPPEHFQTNRIQLIPYAVWQNRGPSEMSVWLPKH
jgi:DUF1680 family protein